MRSPDSLRHLTRLQSLGTVREQRAQLALKRAIAQIKALAQRLEETDDALKALERERVALYEQHSGLMTTGDLFRLKRRESILESRRIELMMAKSEITREAEQAQGEALRAREAVDHARRRRDKMTHVVGLFRRDMRLQEQIQEDQEVEELCYAH